MISKQVGQYSVRRMEARDIDSVIQLDQISFTKPWPEKSYEYELKVNSNAHSWVAVDPLQQVVGFMVIWLVVDEAHIATIAVHPDHRRRGVAKRLLITGLIETINLGAVTSMLEVRAGNVVALRIYYKFGFTEVGRRLRYYQDNHEDAILMTMKPLDDDYLQWLEHGAGGQWERKPD